jgi:hypothetical protein
MSNQLPAHLLALFSSNPDILKVGETIVKDSHAKIKFSGKKWRLAPVSGDEIPVKPIFLKNDAGEPIAQVAAIDVIVVDINEHKSHIVYEKAFVEGEETSPVWSSDDGTPVPMEHQGKLVTDYRRVAVLVADHLDQGVFELRIAPKSLTPFERYNTTIKNFGTPIGAFVTRITFDDAYDYPVLSFAPVAYINDAQSARLAKSLKEEKTQVQAVIGKRNKPQLALPAPVAPVTLPAPALPVEVPIEKQTRKPRTVKAEPAAVFPMPAIAPTPAAQVVTQPTPASSQLDALLANIMKG